MDFLFYGFCILADWFSYSKARLRQWYHCWGWGHEEATLMDVSNRHVICLGCKTCAETFWLEEHNHLED